MRVALVLASLFFATVPVVALAPTASAACVPVVSFTTCCASSALGVTVCYDPYDPPCIVGATFDVGPVDGNACVNWCRILGCPGPVLA